MFLSQTTRTFVLLCISRHTHTYIYIYIYTIGRRILIDFVSFTCLLLVTTTFFVLYVYIYAYYITGYRGYRWVINLFGGSKKNRSSHNPPTREGEPLGWRNTKARFYGKLYDLIDCIYLLWYSYSLSFSVGSIPICDELYKYTNLFVLEYWIVWNACDDVCKLWMTSIVGSCSNQWRFRWFLGRSWRSLSR